MFYKILVGWQLVSGFNVHNKVLDQTNKSLQIKDVQRSSLPEHEYCGYKFFLSIFNLTRITIRPTQIEDVRWNSLLL